MSPEYVEYGALMTPPAPFRSLNTRLWGFWLDADRERLEALCRKVFTEPSHGAVDVRPLGRHVMLTWGSIERVVSEIPEFSRRGGVSEPQVSLWVPVGIVRHEGGGRAVAERFAMFVPYMWLDNAMSLATGRELFGYPKSWGWIGFPADGDRPRAWTLDVFGLDYGPDQLADRHPLIEIVEGETLSEPGDEHDELLDVALHVARGLWDALDEPQRILHGLELAGDIAADLARRELAHVFLKQFRSVEDGMDAALQQIVEARYRVTRLRAVPRLHEHTLTVHALDSHPVAAELGLVSQTTRLAYEVEMDFLVGSGRVLWDAAAS